MKDHELEALRARAHYEAAAKVARNHPKSPYQSAAERRRVEKQAKVRERTMRDAQRPSHIQWGDGQPSYVHPTNNPAQDGCKQYAEKVSALIVAFGFVAYMVARVVLA